MTRGGDLLVFQHRCVTAALSPAATSASDLVLGRPAQPPTVPDKKKGGSEKQWVTQAPHSPATTRSQASAWPCSLSGAKGSNLPLCLGLGDDLESGRASWYD